jgi:hypothetical protein
MSTTYTLPGVTLTNTNAIISKDTKLAMLLWAPSGKGKTKLAGSLHKLTMKYDQKPTLYIAVESGEGGGAATLRRLECPLFVPNSMEDLDRALAALRNDRTFGGVVLDSATEMVKKFVKTKALGYPGRDKGPVQGTLRTAGIPGRSDYQVMGELTRQVFQQLLNMSAVSDLNLKKHIVVTATDRKIEDDLARVTFEGPDLPGAMAASAAAMFQISATIEIRPTVIGTERVPLRFLTTETDGPKALKDRFDVFPKTGTRLKLNDTDALGLDLAEMWEKYWIPQIQN